MWLALATTPSLHASGQADERYEVTPTTLPELIEGVGLEAIDWDVWTVYRQGGEPIVHTRTRAYVDGDVVVFAEYSQVLHSDIYARVCLYTTEGELLEDRYWVREKVRGGWAEEGQWVLRTVFSDRNVTTFFLNEKGGWDPQLQYTYQPLDEAVHEFWVPLAVQYHIERAHERFELERFYYPVNSGSLRRLRFQLSGTETLLVDGQATDCFVYEVVEETRHRDPQSEQQSWVAYKVFTSEGHFVREWYPHSPPETDDIARCEPGVMPDGFEDFPFMIEAGIGDEVFGRAGEDTLVDVEGADESTD